MKWESQWGTSHYPLFCIAKKLPEIECCFIGKHDNLGKQVYNGIDL